MNSKYQDDLTHIRSMMEKSTRFVSLSGLSGIVAGIIALVGAAIAFFLIETHGVDYTDYTRQNFTRSLNIKLFLLAVIILIAATSSGYYFTYRKSKKTKQKIWNKLSQTILVHLAVPLLAGGIFCLALLYHNIYILVAPTMLIFYGLALVNASKFTYGDIRWLGYLEILLGLISAFFVGYGLIFWVIGFGVLHIVYGIVMFNKYDKK